MALDVLQPGPVPCDAGVAVEPLENGDHLSAREFLRRYEASPEVKKAELVNGIVYMASPTRIELHGEPDGLVQTWLGNYGAATPGVRHAVNSTVRLGPDDVPQPDGLLRLLPEVGGRSRVDAKGYLSGGPELVVEIAASSASLDTREKRDSYRRARVGEYVVICTQDARIDWWVLDEDEFVALSPDLEGVLRSKVFPGLWLDTKALLTGNATQLLSTLRRGLETAEHATFVAEIEQRVAKPTPKV